MVFAGLFGLVLVRDADSCLRRIWRLLGGGDDNGSGLASIGLFVVDVTHSNCARR